MPPAYDNSRRFPARRRGRRKVCGDFGSGPRAFNGQDDHAYLLVEYPPKVTIAGLVNPLKGVPARRPRSEFTGHVNRHTMHGHLWSPSYLRRILRRRPAEHHPPVHRTAKAPGYRNFRANPALK